MQGNIMAQEKEYILNESFKALLESIFSNPEQSQKLIKAFEEVVNDRATTQRLNFENLKNQAIEEIRQELVNKDTFKAEIQRVETEIKRVESSLSSEIKRVESSLSSEIKRVESSLSSEIKRVESSLRQQGIYWLLGVAVVSTITVISSVWAMMNFMLESLK
ncbi:hypothetical protein [Campylobacter peloridis]|uniref:hypothetical protein n=1 Tax=Campylobacter peloridis TaxID=488546 RepID=UPI001C737643|nr:hypothetical protein [Campylobacter peloridis]MBX1886171.1 hypothetical protein [Campylobacter peloridis]